MSNQTTGIKRSTVENIIALLCVLTALVQIAGGAMILHQAPEGALFPATGSAVGVRVLALFCATVLLYLAAGVAVFRFRVEALACMGWLLAQLLMRLVGQPGQSAGLLDSVFLVALVIFTMRLFWQSSATGAEAGPGWRHPLAMLLLGLAAGQLTTLVTNLWPYWMLVSSGSVSKLAILSALIGCVALYAAIMMMVARPGRARKCFLLAALVIGLSLPAFSVRFGFSAPFWLGFPLAVLGFGLARHFERKASKTLG